jgi:hypothetical protein
VNPCKTCGINIDEEALKAARRKLRDEFAGQALQGIVANNAFFGFSFQQSPEAAADFAYRAADAMLKERER